MHEAMEEERAAARVRMMKDMGLAAMVAMTPTERGDEDFDVKLIDEPEVNPDDYRPRRRGQRLAR